MTCPRRKYLSQYLDGEVSDKRRRSIDAHLSSCAKCTAMLGEMKLIGGMLKESDRFPAPYGFSRRVMAGVEAIGRRRRGRLVPAFVWAAESVLVLLVLVIGAAAGLIASSAVRQEPRGPSWVLDVFDPVPQDSFGAIYLSAAEAGYEK